MDLHIKDVLKKIIQEDGSFGDQYYQQKISSFWKSRYAASIRERTRSIRYDNGHLRVTIDSAPLRHELFTSRDKIKDEINAHLQEDLVRKLTFL